jgi:Protein of unknown function (DUF4058)
MAHYSQSYVQHLTQGPFPRQIDPWAEMGRYFHQLHSEIISDLLGQIREPLLMMGYFAGRESSLQIAEDRQPDIYFHLQYRPASEVSTWNYTQAAATVSAETGTLLEGLEPELDAMHIKEMNAGKLVTVIEIISPRNKKNTDEIEEYQGRRKRLLNQGVNVVEVDLTRSVKRLIPGTHYPYHFAVHLHDQPPRLVGINFGEALKRCAIPLRAEVIAVELQDAYDHAYRQTSMAVQIQNEIAYNAIDLPFPSLLTSNQKEIALQAVQDWQAKLHTEKES